MRSKPCLGSNRSVDVNVRRCFVFLFLLFLSSCNVVLFDSAFCCSSFVLFLLFVSETLSVETFFFSFDRCICVLNESHNSIKALTDFMLASLSLSFFLYFLFVNYLYFYFYFLLLLLLKYIHFTMWCHLRRRFFLFSKQMFTVRNFSFPRNDRISHDFLSSHFRHSTLNSSKIHYIFCTCLQNG